MKTASSECFAHAIFKRTVVLLNKHYKKILLVTNPMLFACLVTPISIFTTQVDIRVHGLVESSTSSEPDNAFSNPTCKDFFDNCAYHKKNTKQFGNFKRDFFIMNF